MAYLTVKELIEFLQTQDPDLPVAYRCFSEQMSLVADDIEVEELCEARNDGWLQNKRPDMPTKKYLVFPGN